MKQSPTLITAALFPTTVFLLNLLCLYTGMYDRFPWLDTPFHFVGGVVIAHFARIFLKFVFAAEFPKAGWLQIVVISCAAVTAAVLWEFAEWTSDTYFGGHHQLSITDTMKDLLLGMLGGLLYALWVARKKLRVLPNGVCTLLQIK